MTEYRWCGLLGRRHNATICEQFRDDKKKIRERCKYLSDTNGCDFLTTEEKIERAKAHKEEEEVKENDRQEENNSNIDGNTSEGTD
jgi:hypothetical protein